MIQFYNRVSQQLENETVYGGSFVDWAYGSGLGLFLTRSLFSKRWLSLLMGAYEDSKISISQIARFVEAYKIRMEDFEAAEYQNFNEFFIRRFKPGVRKFEGDERVFAAGAEARYLAFENLKADQKFSVKGIEINLSQIVKNEDEAKRFEGGTLLIARLCPVDYHRFHFPVSGFVKKHYPIHGALHSVNPAVFTAEPRVFLENEREVAFLETEHFGTTAMIEVGALGVGKIIQSAYSNRHALPHKFVKGQEKGYFLFGGSTVIWLIEPGKIKLDDDLVKYSQEGTEVWLPLGASIGKAIGKAIS